MSIKIATVAASRKAWAALILVMCTLILSSQSLAQADINLQALIKDTQKMSRASNEITLVWWIPEQYWQASMEQDSTVTKAQANEILETVRPYTIIAVVDGQIGAFGGVTYATEEAIRSSVTIKDAKGSSYAPLSESEVGPDATNLLQMLEPVIGNMLGPLGENMHFLAFQNNDGAAVVDPTTEGMLHVLVGDEEYKYRLPLGSVLPPKYDAKTGKLFPGNYDYSPFTGDELVTEPPNESSDRTQ